MALHSGSLSLPLTLVIVINSLISTPVPMKTHYIEEAAKVVTNKQQLVNMVSKRLRELSAGSRPMVEVDLEMGLADIALAEIAAGKISTEESPFDGTSAEAA